MSRRRNKNKIAKWGEGKHRKARMQRFAAKNPDSKKNPQNQKRIVGMSKVHAAPYGT